MVLLDGHVLWFYDPNSKASVRISPQQRLIGQAAIGDVLTVNLAVDYTGTLLGDETIQDAGRKDRQCWHLDMKAANDQAVYNRIEYWVEHGTYYPDQGQVLFRQRPAAEDSLLPRLRGAARPRPADRGRHHRRGRHLARDDVQVRRVSGQDIPDAWFQRDYLPRLQPE